ncbi:MAG: SIMPL domain-containing protein [Pseudoruegeria sp.]
MRKLMITMALLLPVPALADAPSRLITVTGAGQIAAAPDMATISLGVTSEGATSSEAMKENSAQVHMILESLAQAGIEPRDIQTNSLNLSPRWSQTKTGSNDRQIVGFVARNGVQVRVRALGDLSDVLGAAVDTGANQLNGLQFGLSDPKAHTDDARRAAVSDARDKAELYAQAAGVSLGSVVTITENGGYAPQPRMMEAAMMARDAVPVAEGEVTVNVTVTMVFEITD